MSDAHPDPTVWWRHRRRMAYIAMGVIVGVGFGGIVVHLTEPQSSLLQAVVYACAAIIGAYVGFSTWDDVKRRT